MRGENDALANVAPLIDIFGDGGKFLTKWPGDIEVEELRIHNRTGRPLGTERFVRRLEKQLGRILGPQKGGRPGKK